MPKDQESIIAKVVLPTSGTNWQAVGWEWHCRGISAAEIVDIVTDNFGASLDRHFKLIERCQELRTWTTATRQTSRQVREESMQARMRRCTGSGCKCRDSTSDPW